MTYARAVGRADKAAQIYQRADKWRSFIRVMATIGGFIAFVALINGSKDFYGEFDGGAFVTGLITYGVAIGVGTVPYFILARILQGVGSVVEEATALRQERDALAVRVDDLEDELKERGNQSVSMDAARLMATIGAHGAATFDQIGEQVGIEQSELRDLVDELLHGDLIEQSADGSYGILDSHTSGGPDEQPGATSGPTVQSADLADLPQEALAVFRALASMGVGTVAEITNQTGIYPDNVSVAIGRLAARLLVRARAGQVPVRRPLDSRRERSTQQDPLLRDVRLSDVGESGRRAASWSPSAADVAAVGLTWGPRARSARKLPAPSRSTARPRPDRREAQLGRGSGSSLPLDFWRSVASMRSRKTSGTSMRPGPPHRLDL